MTIIQASKITLNEVELLFGFQELYDGEFAPFLSLEQVTEAEQQEIIKIRNDFRFYLKEKEASEGQVRLIAVAPLLRLAGFYQFPIQLRVEQAIDRINIEDEDTSITGRFDIIAVNKEKQTANDVNFWVLVIETKPSLADSWAGLPQLLTYAYKSLERQTSTWGLTTNGRNYQFVYIQQGNPPTYMLMPELQLMKSSSAIQLLQVLKAICQL
ncbi:MAG: restriction endonuclease subunit R [Hormoscilla sp. SP5CHS1]|nr:restriction endonuclease subunit R [Hormoscilla sp. SP12CHS1]MBC6454697.1 restriction endonuclease subunit R [Hormoscilla sp. SP5CHS1]